jgi:ribonuclease HI
MSWIAYTDGACAPTNPGPAGWGAVLIEPDGKTESDHYGFIGQGTNQIAELTAAIEGLARVPVGDAVELVSDSQYVLKGIKEWRAGWERRGWKNAAGQPVANKALWVRLFALADERKVTTRWVRGHNGDVYNERADALANKSLRLKSSSVLAAS